MGGGKSGGIGTTYDYYGTMAGAICIGPNEDLVAIILNGQEVWPKGTPWAVGITCNAGTLYVFDAQTWTCTTTHVATALNAPGSGLEGWVEYTFARTTEDHDDFTLTTSDGTTYGVMTLYWGTPTQTVNPALESTGNDGGVNGNYGHGDQHPNYPGVVYVVIGPGFLLGEEVQSGPNIEIVMRRKPNQTVIGGSAALITDGQANLAAVGVELLTDENCLGLPTGVIDSVSFQAVADWLQTNQALYGASVLIDASESINSIFDKLIQMFDGYIRFNPATQKIELGVYQHGVTPAAYTTLTADSFTKFPKFSAKSWQETISRATVRYNDRQINYQQTSVQVDDPRAFFVLGTVREQSLDRPWIARAAQALQHGRETLRVIGHAQLTGELEVRREIGRTIRPGDYVLVDVDLEPNAYTITQFFRVTQTKMPPIGPITLSVFADNTLAPVPWSGPGNPLTTLAPAVPPITSFRFLEVPTILSGERGAIICLAQRPSNLLIGATIYYDTNPAGTFNSLGIMNNFAAQATLYTNVAATDTTIQLTVDTTQVDADYFTVQYSAIQQTDDTLLAFIVSVVPGDGDAGEVAEAGGYQIMEIVSVSTQTLISAGQYNLSVLRGRQNTVPTAFTTANTEVWLIPQALLSFFNATSFDQIRANRLSGLTPAYAQFRICPFTFVNSLAVSVAANEQFRFPLKSISAPTLTLTTPNAYSLAETPGAYPFSLQVRGTWSDPDNSIVQVKVLLRLSTDTADRVVSDLTFAPTGSYAFNNFAQLDAPGNWVIKLIARDSNNLTTENDITVTAAAGAAQCALVDIYDADGNQILNAGNTAPQALSQFDHYGDVYSKWGMAPSRFIPFGVLTLKCTTPGAVIHFYTGGTLLTRGDVLTSGAASPDNIYQAGALEPFNGPIETVGRNASGPTFTEYYVINVWATAPGYANSDAIAIIMPLIFPTGITLS